MWCLRSATDATVPPPLRGKYRAFAERDSAGVRFEAYCVDAIAMKPSGCSKCCGRSSIVATIASGLGRSCESHSPSVRHKPQLLERRLTSVAFAAEGVFFSCTAGISAS